MNYYSHHIGDFNNATRHLTRVERALYRDAIELYYDTESVLTKDFDKLSRRLLVVSDDEKVMLKSILNEFFNETDDGYSHDRCDAEIAKYRTNTSNKAKAGIASALARQQKATPVQHVFNEPITKNQEPITNKEHNTIVPFSKSRFDEFWKTYPSSQRKVAKAACEKKWKAKRLDAIAENIITHVKAIQHSTQWADGFSPAPLTYINQERWNDGLHADSTVEPEWKRGML